MNRTRTQDQNHDDGQELYAQLLDTCEPETAEGSSIRIDHYEQKEGVRQLEKPRRCK